MNWGVEKGLEGQLQQLIGNAARVLGSDPVPKAGQGQLGGQVLGSLRGLAGHDLEGRAPGEQGGVVLVLVTQGNGEQPLPQQGEISCVALAACRGLCRKRAVCSAIR